MHLERIGDIAILDLISATIPTCYKNLVINLEAALAGHEYRYRLQFDLFCNGHACLVQDEQIMVFSSNNQESLTLLAFYTFLDADHAGNEVFMAESCATLHI